MRRTSSYRGTSLKIVSRRHKPYASLLTRWQRTALPALTLTMPMPTLWLCSQDNRRCDEVDYKELYNGEFMTAPWLLAARIEYLGSVYFQFVEDAGIASLGRALALYGSRRFVVVPVENGVCVDGAPFSILMYGRIPTPYVWDDIDMIWVLNGAFQHSIDTGLTTFDVQFTSQSFHGQDATLTGATLPPHFTASMEMAGDVCTLYSVHLRDGWRTLAALHCATRPTSATKKRQVRSASASPWMPPRSLTSSSWRRRSSSCTTAARAVVPPDAHVEHDGRGRDPSC